MHKMIALMMEAVSTSETSVNFYQTIQRNIPEDNHLHTRRRENLRSHTFKHFRFDLISVEGKFLRSTQFI
jgi:hypothetical protein